MLIHTDEKPHQCRQCGIAFKQKSNLTCHMNSQTRENPYQCSHCDKAFVIKKSQTTHLKVLIPSGADHDYDFWLEGTLSYQKKFKRICPKMDIIVDSEFLYHRNKI